MRSRDNRCVWMESAAALISLLQRMILPETSAAFPGHAARPAERSRNARQEVETPS